MLSKGTVQKNLGEKNMNEVEYSKGGARSSRCFGNEYVWGIEYAIQVQQAAAAEKSIDRRRGFGRATKSYGSRQDKLQKTGTKGKMRV